MWVRYTEPRRLGVICRWGIPRVSWAASRWSPQYGYWDPRPFNTLQESYLPLSQTFCIPNNQDQGLYVCYLMTGGQNSSQIPWTMVPDPITPTKALMSVGGCQVVVIKVGIHWVKFSSDILLISVPHHPFFSWINTPTIVIGLWSISRVLKKLI